MPTNLYGPYDSYGEDKSHVVAALIRRASTSKDKLLVWGSGTPLRQFCFVGDLCKLVLWIAFRPERTETIALLPAEEHSIAEMAQCVASAFNLAGIEFDRSKADGQHRKAMSNELMRQQLGGKFEFTSLQKGISLTVAHYLSHASL